MSEPSRIAVLKQSFTPLLTLLSETHRKGFEELCALAIFGESMRTVGVNLEKDLQRLQSTPASKAKAAPSSKKPAPKAKTPTQPKASTKSKSPAPSLAPTAKPSPPARRLPTQPAVPLRHYVLQVLQSNRDPLPLRMIAERVLQAGYKTQSKQLNKNVSSLLGKMQQVQRTANGTYRLQAQA